MPPTRLDVVVETMKISQKVAAKCGDQNALVHYDLAITKLALLIKAQESPLYDNIFVSQKWLLFASPYIYARMDLPMDMNSEFGGAQK